MSPPQPGAAHTITASAQSSVRLRHACSRSQTTALFERQEATANGRWPDGHRCVPAGTPPAGWGLSEARFSGGGVVAWCAEVSPRARLPRYEREVLRADNASHWGTGPASPYSWAIRTRESGKVCATPRQCWCPNTPGLCRVMTHGIRTLIDDSLSLGPTGPSNDCPTSPCVPELVQAAGPWTAARSETRPPTTDVAARVRQATCCAEG